MQLRGEVFASVIGSPDFKMNGGLVRPPYRGLSLRGSYMGGGRAGRQGRGHPPTPRAVLQSVGSHLSSLGEIKHILQEWSYLSNDSYGTDSLARCLSTNLGVLGFFFFFILSL